MKCMVCKEIKLAEEFNWKNKTKGIKKNYCRVCDREIKKRYYEKHRQKVIRENVVRATAKRDSFRMWKSTLCCCMCGESEEACLDFHHVDPSVKEHTISSLLRDSSLEKIKKELSKCIVVCRNCHAKIHKYNLEVPKAGVVFNG